MLGREEREHRNFNGKLVSMRTDKHTELYGETIFTTGDPEGMDVHLL